MNTFAVSSVEVGWLQDHPAYAVPTGAGVDTSQILVIRTNRTSFSPQNFVGFSATETFAAGDPPVTVSDLFRVQAVPEPSTMMLVLGGAAFGAIRKRRSAAKLQ